MCDAACKAVATTGNVDNIMFWLLTSLTHKFVADPMKPCVIDRRRVKAEMHIENRCNVSTIRLEKMLYLR